MWKWINRIAIAFLVVLLLLKGLDWMSRHSKSLPPVPQDNSYTALLTDAEKIVKPSGDVVDLSTDELKNWLEQNHLATEAATRILEKGNIAVPLSTERDWMKKHREEIKSFRNLAISYSLESRLLNLNGHTNSQPALNLIRLGQAICRGGVKADVVNGLTLEVLGVGLLQANLAGLDAAECRKAAQFLEEQETHRETALQVLQNEKTWLDASYGLVSRILGFADAKENEKNQSEFTIRYHRTRGLTSRLMVRLAARAYELDNGKPAATVVDLVPSYLKKIPQDPETGKTVTLRQSTEKSPAGKKEDNKLEK